MLDLTGLKCAALTQKEIRAIPEQFAPTTKLTEELGFGGVQIRAAHGFLLSQFLSHLFNQRTDAYGGAISEQMRLVLETVEVVRDAVSPGFVLALKLNSSDQLSGGLTEHDALKVVQALDSHGLELLDISGGSYFTGAPSSSDRIATGPYVLDFAKEVRKRTRIPLMVTGGFKRRGKV